MVPCISITIKWRCTAEEYSYRFNLVACESDLIIHSDSFGLFSDDEPMSDEKLADSPPPPPPSVVKDIVVPVSPIPNPYHKKEKKALFDSPKALAVTPTNDGMMMFEHDFDYAEHNK